MNDPLGLFKPVLPNPLDDPFDNPFARERRRIDSYNRAMGELDRKHENGVLEPEFYQIEKNRIGMQHVPDFNDSVALKLMRDGLPSSSPLDDYLTAGAETARKIGLNTERDDCGQITNPGKLARIARGINY
jgi:hypothetical protein